MADFVGGVFIAIHDGNHHAHQRRVGAIQAHGVHHHPELGLVLAGDGTIARLIPIQHQAALVAMRHHVAVHLNGHGPAHVDRHYRPNSAASNRCREDSSWANAGPCRCAASGTRRQTGSRPAPLDGVKPVQQIVRFQNGLRVGVDHAFLQQLPGTQRTRATATKARPLGGDSGRTAL